MIEFWMTFIGITMSLSGLSQIIKLIKRKSSEDISLLYWFLIIHGQAWWLWYGFQKSSLSLIITNSICVISSSLVLFLSVKYKKK